MRSFPPVVFLLLVAILSGLAGALLTWIVLYLTGGRQRAPARRAPAKAGAADEELLRVTRTRGEPAVIVQGSPVSHLREIEDRQVGQDTVSAIRAVLAFAEGWLPALSDQEAAGAPGSGRAVRSTAVDHPARIGPRPVPDPSWAEPLKLVEEVDALIQRRLQKRPDLAKRGIRLSRDLEGHLLIYVGRQRYQSLDEISDDEVVDFLREAIESWNNQQPAR